MFNPESNANTIDQKYFLTILTEMQKTNELLAQQLEVLSAIAKHLEPKVVEKKVVKPKPKITKPKMTKPKRGKNDVKA